MTTKTPARQRVVQELIPPTLSLSLAPVRARRSGRLLAVMHRMLAAVFIIALNMKPAN